MVYPDSPRAPGAAVVTPLVNIPGVTFSNVPTSLPSDVEGLNVVLSVFGLLILLFMFAGGGSWDAGRWCP